MIGEKYLVLEKKKSLSETSLQEQMQEIPTREPLWSLCRHYLETCSLLKTMIQGTG